MEDMKVQDILVYKSNPVANNTKADLHIMYCRSCSLVFILLVSANKNQRPRSARPLHDQLLIFCIDPDLPAHYATSDLCLGCLQFYPA